MKASETQGLEKMKVKELQALFFKILGETTRCPNRVYLIRRIQEGPEPTTNEPLAAKLKGDDRGQIGNDPLDPGAAEAPAGILAEEAGTVSSKPVPALEIKLSQLDLPALRARYLEVIGRETHSSNRGYLVWKLREAERARIPTGSRKTRKTEAIMVLPLRLEATVVEQMDEAWRRLGLRNRSELIRVSLGSYLAAAGEGAVADLIVPRR